MSSSSSSRRRSRSRGNRDSSNNKESTSNEKFRAQMNVMQREMEIAEYATVGIQRNARRKTPRKTMGERTRKRKLLEKEDATESSTMVDVVENRLRGSRKMLEEEHVQDTLLMRGDDEEEEEEEDDDDESESEEDDNEEEEEEEEEEVEEESEGEDDEEDEEEEEVVEEEEEEEFVDEEEEFVNDENYEEDEVQEEDVDVEEDEIDEEIEEEIIEEPKQPKKRKYKKRKKKLGTVSRTKKKRKLYRMKNFKSARMAERHGDALSAHARGDHVLAIKKLEAVAADAPSAPQVYASLGMVYEEMMRTVVEGGDNNDDPWKDRVECAKKAYGAYHISAVLCKKDYMAWVRAADTARVVANLYTVAMEEQGDADKYRADKLHWIQETLKDYRSADNLKPPGMDVPAKLAAAHMELGNLSEALAILTDLKNRRQQQTHQTWMLYSDLMLRIGHECTQWNKGDQFQQNYMFRRWLRKYSEVFDWQERRLQALVLALECAAGSDSCCKVVEWARQRAKSRSNHQSKAATKEVRWSMDTYENQPSGEGDKELGDDKGDTTTSSSANPAGGLTSSKEGEDLVHDADDMEERNDVEDKLEGADADVDMEDADGEVKTTNFPISASCATVTEIASLLMKHCLGLELFDGGQLVAESVVLYLRERATQREKRTQANLAFAEKQKSTAKSILLHKETYDEINEDEADSDAESVPDYLSDEEGLDGNPELVKYMKTGTLPPELQVLFALGLIAEGGKNFLASQCIKSIEGLDNDTAAAVEIKLVDTDTISYPAWQVYRRAMTNPLTKVAGLAFVADMLKKTNKEKEWADRLSPLFWKEIECMQAAGVIEQALSAEKSKSPGTVLRRTQVLKIALAGSRFRMVQADSEATCDSEKAADIFLQCFDDIYCAMRPLWKITEFGTPLTTSVEALQVIANAAHLVESTSTVDEDATLKRLDNIITMLTGSPNEKDESTNKAPEKDADWGGVPFSSDFQDSHLRSQSLRAHNLCVANSVTLFPGWTSEEFNLNLLQKKGKNSYFGITLHEGRVIGHIDAETARGLEQIWKIVSRLTNVEFDFNGSRVRASNFLEHGNVIPQPADDTAALHGEDSALSLIISYMKQCFSAAEKVGDASTARQDFLKRGMALLLPVTQFCILDRVWDSSIGMAPIGSLSRIQDLRSVAGGSRSKRKTRVTTKYSQRSIGQWHQLERNLIGRVVPIPMKHILADWNGDGDSVEGSVVQTTLTKTPVETTAANELQRKLDTAMKQLRVCTTEHALQKANLQVTLALIDLLPCVANPFIVMHHAAMFASQCSKRGDLNEHFKTGLPKKASCEPKEALEILVRSDCMQSVHFTMEATFLCSFVAQCIKWRRENFLWNAQWKVVGIYCYNISLAIRSTICTTSATRESQSKALEAWADDVLSELERCRLDALDMRKAIGGVEIEQEEEDDDEDEVLDEDDDGRLALDDETEKQEATEDALADAMDKLANNTDPEQSRHLFVESNARRKDSDADPEDIVAV